MERPIAYMGDQPYIFISYSHKDSDRVWPIILKLQAGGFRVWYDDGISPGTEWDANIAMHIRKCSFFLAFISGNYLTSDNCKDELSFVRDLSKNRVLIYLEEVILPDEMQMRLGRLQAIYWNRLGEEKSYKKLMLSPGLNVCKEPPAAPAAAAPAAVTPAASTSAASTSAAASPQPANSPDTRPAEHKVEAKVVPDKPEQPSKKSPVLFAGIGAALILILVLVFAMKPSKPSGTAEDTAPVEETTATDDSQEEATAEEEAGSVEESGSSETDTESGTMTGLASVYKNGIVRSKDGSLLAGILTAEIVFNNKISVTQDLDYNGETYTVSLLPYTTISSYDDQNSIILRFRDEYDGDFYFYGTYTIDGESLIITPGGSAGTFEKECAPLTRELTYTLQLQDGYITLSNGDHSIDMIGYSEDPNILTLKGSLSEGSESYKGIQSLDLEMDLETDELKKCVLIINDGERTGTAVIDSCSNLGSFHQISLRWSSIEYTVNGRPVTESVFGKLDITYLNQDPVGFTVFDYTNDMAPYYYQGEM